MWIAGPPPAPRPHAEATPSHTPAQRPGSSPEPAGWQHGLPPAGRRPGRGGGQGTWAAPLQLRGLRGAGLAPRPGLRGGPHPAGLAVHGVETRPVPQPHRLPLDFPPSPLPRRPEPGTSGELSTAHRPPHPGWAPAALASSPLGTVCTVRGGLLGLTDPKSLFRCHFLQAGPTRGQGRVFPGQAPPLCPRQLPADLSPGTAGGGPPTLGSRGLLLHPRTARGTSSRHLSLALPWHRQVRGPPLPPSVTCSPDTGPLGVGGS